MVYEWQGDEEYDFNICHGNTAPATDRIRRDERDPSLQRLSRMDLPTSFLLYEGRAPSAGAAENEYSRAMGRVPVPVVPAVPPYRSSMPSPSPPPEPAPASAPRPITVHRPPPAPWNITVNLQRFHDFHDVSPPRGMCPYPLLFLVFVHFEHEQEIGSSQIRDELHHDRMTPFII